MSSWPLDARELDRRRLAQDVHDVVGQALVAVQVSLARVQRLAGASDLADEVGAAMHAVETALGDVRELTADLRPSMLDDFGLVAAVRHHLARQCTRAGLTSNFEARAVPSSLPADLEAACFRIAQEAITNVVRHAGASAIRVTLRRRWADLELVIQDDGFGFDVLQLRHEAGGRAHLGLVGMRERAEELGGSLRVASGTSGTVVAARLPLAGTGRPT